MKNCIKHFFCLILTFVICISTVNIPRAQAATIPADYASALSIMEKCNYIIDGSSVYLLLDYEVGTGQSWSYLRRASADVNYVSNTVFTESGENYIGDKAIAMFRFDASSAGIFRVVVYLNQGGVIASDPVCFNFVVTGNDTDGYIFSERYPQSDLIPMDYYEAQNVDGFVVDKDLMIVCFDSTQSWKVSVASSFTWQVDTNISVPIQSVEEFALSEEESGYSVIAIKVTSAGDGKVILTSEDGTQKIEYPISATVSDSGDIILADERIKYGDINSDGVIDAIDATLATRATVGIFTLSDEQKLIADVNGDGVVDAIDATLITRYSVGILTAFPIA